jgi:hypothetical protein
MREVFRHIAFEQTHASQDSRNEAHCGDSAPGPEAPHHLARATVVCSATLTALRSCLPVVGRSRPTHGRAIPKYINSH